MSLPWPLPRVSLPSDTWYPFSANTEIAQQLPSRHFQIFYFQKSTDHRFAQTRDGAKSEVTAVGKAQSNRRNRIRIRNCCGECPRMPIIELIASWQSTIPSCRGCARIYFPVSTGHTQMRLAVLFCNRMLHNLGDQRALAVILYHHVPSGRAY
jgi:hypothetical protein